MDPNSTVTYVVQSSQGPLIDFLVQLAATLIGVLVGFYLAFAWDGKKKNDKIHSIRNDTMESLIAELEDIRKTTNDAQIEIKVENNLLSVTFPLCLTPSFDSAIHSGNFSLLSPSLQVKLSNIYTTITLLNSIAKQAAEQSSNPHNLPIDHLKPTLAGKIEQMKILCKREIKEIEELLPILKSEKNNQNEPTVDKEN